MLITLVILPCMIRKCGLLMFSCTERNRSCTREGVALLPLIRYLFRPPITIWMITNSNNSNNNEVSLIF